MGESLAPNVRLTAHIWLTAPCFFFLNTHFIIVYRNPEINPKIHAESDCEILSSFLLATLKGLGFFASFLPRVDYGFSRFFPLVHR